jgi:FkbM family methyltransferase
MIKEFIKEIKGINFIDIGSSGSLDTKWKNIEAYINMIGFDPNEEECERMSALPHNFRSLDYLPYAVAGDEQEHTLFKTKSIYCYSLLEPDTNWLNRFSFGDLFEITGKDLINTVLLSKVEALKNLDVDIIKTDTQGLELPILSNADDLLDKAFFVETETGFVENYKGETTYAEIDLFMRSKGYFLFDLNINHRIPRNNQFKEEPTGSEQIMWGEATWMKDYVSLFEKGLINVNSLSREKVLKALVICGLQGCIDFGFELAVLFNRLNLLDTRDLMALKDKKAWLIADAPEKITSLIDDKPLPKEIKSNLIATFLRLLPTSLRREISNQAQLSVRKKHLFKP